jgi:hypothetical protein
VTLLPRRGTKYKHAVAAHVDAATTSAQGRKPNLFELHGYTQAVSK